jgi:hypothetical protein
MAILEEKPAGRILRAQSFMLGDVVTFFCDLQGKTPVDWNMVAALAACASAFVAIGAVIVSWRQARQTASTEVLLNLDAAWRSAPMYPRCRRDAAQILLESLYRAKIHSAAVIKSERTRVPIALELPDKVSALDSVLDFFETIAVFERKRLVDFELVYQLFFWPVCCYWLLTESYVRDVQKRSGDEVWDGFANLARRFQKRGGDPVSFADAEEFLKDEKSL